jgi:hypothetical protein
MSRSTENDVISKNLSPSQQLLLHLARISLSPADRQAAAELTPHVEWQELGRLASRGGIGGLIATHAMQLDAPTTFKRALTAVTLRIEASNRKLIGLARRLCAAAEAEGLAIIPLKGTALNLAGPYRDLGLREQCDIDLLARPDQLETVERLFRRLGCRPQGSREYSRRYQHHFKFTHGDPSAPVLIELHWTAFHSSFHRLDHDVAALLRSHCVEVEGDTLRMLDPVDTMLSVALHLAVHRYREQLKWLVDVAELGRQRGPTLDWEQLWRRAGALGAKRAVAYAFRLASELLQAPLPMPPGSARLLALTQRLSPPEQLIASCPQPGWGQRAAIDLLGHDGPVGGLRSLVRKGRELVYRRRTKGSWR